MNILVPINNLENIETYLECGAKEFYIGFYDIDWTQKLGDYADLNRLTGYHKKANQYTLQQVLEAIPEIQKKGGVVFITFNASIYSEEQLEFICGYMEQLKEVGVDGIITSCPEIIKMGREAQISCAVSTIAGAYNSDIIQYFKKLGATRIILPRDVLLEDIGTIVSMDPTLEYEVFLMRSGCRYSDSNCLGLHRSEKCSVCIAMDEADPDIKISQDYFDKRHNVELNNIIHRDYFHNDTCGLCAIYRCLQYGIVAGKIVGRKQDWQRLKEDIILINQNIKIAEKCKTEEEYLEKMVLPQNSYYRCKAGLSCYYPDVRFSTNSEERTLHQENRTK